MAEAGRAEAIEQVQKVVKAYRDKIHGVRHDADRLLPEGERIVNEYCENKDNIQVLVQQCYMDNAFFEGMDDEFLIQFAELCRELNQALGLGAKGLDEITGIKKERSDTEKIKYFLKNYKELSNWEYDGHGCFIAKKCDIVGIGRDVLACAF